MHRSGKQREFKKIYIEICLLHFMSLLLSKNAETSLLLHSTEYYIVEF